MKKSRLIAIIMLAVSALTASARFTAEYEAEALAGTASGDFAPYYISSLRHGRLTSPHNAQVMGRIWHITDTTKRFSWGFGVSLLGGYASTTDYERYTPADGGHWIVNPQHPTSFRVQEAYGEVKFRGVFMSVGAREHTSALLTQRLTSGDLVESGNAAPIPEARIGFINFQIIPFTNGWVQIQGEIGYGKMLDSDWWEDRYNRYNYHITSGEWYNYKRCYFRTKPAMPFSVTLGMQAAATFGGRMKRYIKGELVSERHFNLNFKSFWNAFLPNPGGEDFYEGNHLGSWDFMARYRFSSGETVRAYFEWPWEDGSGIGRRNGWDGLWGLEYIAADRNGWLTGALVEYLDFTNQSGPQHFAPGDRPGTTIANESTGCDDYYNNQMYNAYAYYGMSIGTPALMAPIYNLDGYPAYIANRLRGFHAAAEGCISNSLRWRLKGGYRRAWGNGRIILPRPIHLTSVSADIDWEISSVPGLKVSGQLAYDHGEMPGNSFGALVSVSYRGLLNL